MIYYNENDRHCAAWLRELIKEGLLEQGVVDERDINEVESEDLNGFKQCHFFAGIGGWPYALKVANWPKDEVVWTGSCPCQPFSRQVFGRACGMGDKRHLWPVFRRLIQDKKPSTVFGEQVAGKAGRLWMSGVRIDLEEDGFGVGVASLCAASAGAPHERERFYWVADSTGQRWERHRKKRTVSVCTVKECSKLRNQIVAIEEGMEGDLGFLLRGDGISLAMESRAVKGYGNAVFPPLAVEFIRSFMELKK